ncbi:hypothetical protein D9M69_666950 [compost metagenome]
MPTPFARVLDVDREWFRAYRDTATMQQKADIREFADVLRLEMTRRGYGAATDEREEILIGAITRYLIQSQQ